MCTTITLAVGGVDMYVGARPYVWYNTHDVPYIHLLYPASVRKSQPSKPSPRYTVGRAGVGESAGGGGKNDFPRKRISLNKAAETSGFLALSDHTHVGIDSTTTSQYSTKQQQ